MRDASLGVEVTLADREPDDRLPKGRRDTADPENARESASTST